MNNTLHTPAPWQVKYEKTGRTIDAVIKIGTAAVYFTRGIGQTFEEQQANAHLISAAPNLLSALEGFIELYEQGQLKLEGDRGSDPLILKSVNAIAKAKGEAL